MDYCASWRFAMFCITRLLIWVCVCLGISVCECVWVCEYWGQIDARRKFAIGDKLCRVISLENALTPHFLCWKCALRFGRNASSAHSQVFDSRICPCTSPRLWTLGNVRSQGTHNCQLLARFVQAVAVRGFRDWLNVSIGRRKMRKCRLSDVCWDGFLCAV